MRTSFRLQTGFMAIALLLPLVLLPADLEKEIKKMSERHLAEACEIRRQLHQIPELCYQEVETARFVRSYLEKLGLTVVPLAKGGMKAVIVGRRAKPVIALRSDMDALPINEETGLPFRSQHPGQMHACGHDVHMANVLICARLLTELRSRLPGAVVLFFQPCEEGAPAGMTSGAAALIESGVLENPHVDAMLGLHVFPDLAAGCIGIRPGPIMASADWFYIAILGKASHGAFPHQGIDAIYAAALAVVEFQALISRQKDPGEKAVLSIGKISGGTRNNVIADRVEMQGTVRTFSVTVQQALQSGMEKILQGLETACGIRYTFNYETGNPFVNNDTALTAFFTPLFERMLGHDKVITIEPQTIAEDYALYSQRIPALFFMLGTGGGTPLHSANFDVAESVLATAPALLTAAAFRYLEHFGHD